MFEVNDVVVYSSQGVCQIVGTEQQKTGGCQQRHTDIALQPPAFGGGVLRFFRFQKAVHLLCH